MGEARTTHAATLSAQRVMIDGVSYEIEVDWTPASPLARVQCGGQQHAVQVMRDGVDWRLRQRGFEVHVRVVLPRVAELFALMPVKAPPDMSKFLLSPMPGLLVTLMVEEGQQVEPGQDLAIVEAMKMENVLRAERGAQVAKVLAAQGDSLSVDQPILEFE